MTLFNDVNMQISKKNLINHAPFRDFFSVAIWQPCSMKVEVQNQCSCKNMVRTGLITNVYVAYCIGLMQDHDGQANGRVGGK